MGDIHELFVLALSLVWFAGATPEKGLYTCCKGWGGWKKQENGCATSCQEEFLERVSRSVSNMSSCDKKFFQIQPNCSLQGSQTAQNLEKRISEPTPQKGAFRVKKPFLCTEESGDGFWGLNNLVGVLPHLPGGNFRAIFSQA